MIKQITSGLYCAVADAKRHKSEPMIFVKQPIILSDIPTIWNIEYEDVEAQTIQ